MADSEILVTGATGLVGGALATRASICALSRRKPADSGPWWEPLEGRVHDDARPLRAVVHLAGENVAGGRWTAARRAAIEQSRVLGTRTLVDWLGARPQRPEVLVAASAVGYYGDRGDEHLSESSEPGEGFLAGVCRQWEDEACRAGEAGLRVVRLRFGLVLQAGEGVLGRLEPIFRLGAGGPVGSGQQWFPWVHVNDVVGAILWAIENPAANGAYNVVAPGIVRQGDFARSLGSALNRPALLPTPAFALRLAFGAMADEALLASQRAVPQRLLDGGFAFERPELGKALQNLYEA